MEKTRAVEGIKHGTVELISSSGDDLRIVNAARVSFNTRHATMQTGDDKLINFLMKHRHGTPFEMVDFTFCIKCPISVTREWHRHRIASYNEVSGRYVKLEPEFYVPEGEACREQQGKPGAYYYQPIQDTVNLVKGRSLFMNQYAWAYKAYEELLDLGWAKEVARNVLPVGLFTQFFFKTNARALMNFLSLRNDERAMWEIQQYAKILEDMMQTVIPITHESFVKNGRVAP